MEQGGVISMSTLDATTAVDPREQRGLQIAATSKIVRQGEEWLVPSQSGKGDYRVNLDEQRCNCPDHEVRHTRCKHIIAAEIIYKGETAPDGTVTETKSVKVIYTQDWPNYNLAQQNEKAQFVALLRDLCATVEQPEQTMGRPGLPLADMAFATTFKVYSGFSSRRFTTDLRHAAYLGLIDHAPHFNSVSNYLADPTLTPILRELVERSAGPLQSVEVDFAVDSTGFATKIYHRWYDEKYGKERSKQPWVKCHLMCGVKTNVVTSVYATATESADTVQLPHLLAATADTFRVRELSADKEYSGRSNLRAVEAVGASAYIPFKARTTGVGHRRDEVWSRAWHYYMFNREQFMEHYHKRSNVEMVMHMLKSKFGPAVRSKTPVAQVNETICKVLAHNICVRIGSFYELGIESTFCTESPAPAQKLLA